MSKREAALGDEYQATTTKHMLENIAELMHENANLKDDNKRLRAELTVSKDLVRELKRVVDQLRESQKREHIKKACRKRFIEVYNKLIDHGLTQTQIAEELCVKQPRIAAIKGGLSPSIDNLSTLVGLAVQEGLISAKN